MAFPILATGIASIPLFKSSSSPTNPAMLYLLSVVVATFVGGLPGGLLASFVSFLGLNFFFTPPLRTFAVAKGEDLLALFAFLSVSLLIATLLTKALSQRIRAEQGEEEARLLYRMSSRLLDGSPLPVALDQFAGDMVELFSLARCEVSATGLDGSLDLVASAGAGRAGSPDGVVVGLKTERGTFGQVTLYPRPGGRFEERQLELAAAFSGQLALALEAATLAEQSRRSQAEAESSRVRAALFSSVTHDLRTPLAAIKASATSLLDQEVSFDAAQRRDLLTTIAEESDRLNRLIANVLSLSRLRAGALVPEKTATPVEDVIEAAVARLRKRGAVIQVQDSSRSSTTGTPEVAKVGSAWALPLRGQSWRLTAGRCRWPVPRAAAPPSGSGYHSIRTRGETSNEGAGDRGRPADRADPPHQPPGPWLRRAVGP